MYVVLSAQSFSFPFKKVATNMDTMIFTLVFLNGLVLGALILVGIILHKLTSPVSKELKKTLEDVASAHNQAVENQVATDKKLHELNLILLGIESKLKTTASIKRESSFGRGL